MLSVYLRFVTILDLSVISQGIEDILADSHIDTMKPSEKEFLNLTTLLYKSLFAIQSGP